MVGAAGVESGLAMRTSIVAAQVAGNAEGVVAVAAVDGFGLEFGFGPDLRRAWSAGFVVALNAGVELAAALVLDGDDVALGVVVGALGALVHGSAVDSHGSCSFHYYESNRPTCSTPLTLLRRWMSLLRWSVSFTNTIIWPSKKPSLAVDGDGAHVHLQAGADDARDVVDEAHPVGAFEADAGQEGQLQLVGPLGAHDAVAVVRHQIDGAGAAGAVNDEALVGFEAEHVVAGNGIAAAGDAVVELVGVLAHHQHIGAHAPDFLHLVVECSWARAPSGAAWSAA